MYSLYKDANVYVKQATDTFEKYLRWYKRMFYTFNIIIGLGTLTTATLTALAVSKTVWSSYPEWYFFVTAGIAAVTTLLSSTINYFLVRDKIHSYKRKLNWIRAEEAKHKMGVGRRYQQKNKDYHLYLSVAAYLDNLSAKKEVEHD